MALPLLLPLLPFFLFPLPLGSMRAAGRTRRRPVINIQAMLLNIVDHGRREKIAHREAATEEQPDLGRRDIILDELVNEMDIRPPPRKPLNCLVHVRARALDDHDAVAAEDMVEIRLAPHAGLAHRRDEVRAREEHDAHVLRDAVRGRHGPEAFDLVLEVIEHDGGALVRLEGLPRVDHEPGRRLLCREGAHRHSAGESQ